MAMHGEHMYKMVAHVMGMRSYPKLQGETGYAYESGMEIFCQHAWITGYRTSATANSNAADHPCRWIIIHESIFSTK